MNCNEQQRIETRKELTDICLYTFVFFGLLALGLTTLFVYSSSDSLLEPAVTCGMFAAISFLGALGSFVIRMLYLRQMKIIADS